MNPPPALGLPGVDILYLQTPPPFGPEPGVGNCFEENKPSGFTFFSSEPDGQLPTRRVLAARRARPASASAVR